MIPIDQITQDKPMKTVPIPPVDTAGLLGTTQGAIDYTNNLALTSQSAQEKLQESQGGITDVMNQLLNKTADTQSANETSGLTAATKQLNDLNAQAQSLNREAQAAPIVAQQNALAGSTRGGNAPVSADLLRTNALKALSLAQQADIATANYTAAKDKAQQIIDLKYKPLEEKLAILRQQYEFNKENFSTADKSRVEALQIALKKQETDLNNAKQEERDRVKNQNELATKAYDNNQADLGSKIAKLDINSPTYKEDLSKLTSRLADPVKAAQLRKLNAEIAGINAENALKSGGGLNSDLTAYATSYADTGKLPSPAELKLSGLNVGQVSTMAKQIPREKGTVVSKLTGSKSTTIPALAQEDFGRLYNVLKLTDELLALDKGRIAGISGGVLSKVFGGTPLGELQGAYETKRKAIVDEISRMQSGAALTADEVKFYSDYLPGRYSESFGLGQNSDKKIKNFKETMDTKLRNGADNNGLSIYGYSKVNVGGKDYTVGDVIDIGGENYRVLPDGTLTDIL